MDGAIYIQTCFIFPCLTAHTNLFPEDMDDGKYYIQDCIPKLISHTDFSSNLIRAIPEKKWGGGGGS